MKYTLDDILDSAISKIINDKLKKQLCAIIDVIKLQRQDGWTDTEIINNILHTYEDFYNETK